MYMKSSLYPARNADGNKGEIPCRWFGDDMMGIFPDRPMFGYEKKWPGGPALKNVFSGVIMNDISRIKGGTRMIRYVITA